MKKAIFIVGAKRTPFGSYGGVFKNTSSADLQVVASQAALKAAGVSPDKIDSVVFGNVMPQTSSDGAFMSRHVALRSGVPIKTPALTVNRLCGSGFQAIVNGAQDILCGTASIALTGGSENMSQAPYAVRNVRFGSQLGSSIPFEDTLSIIFTDTYCKLPMVLIAENLAMKYNISRQEVDEFALRSQTLWKLANDNQAFKEELTPVIVEIKKKKVEVTVDEHPKPQTTLEDLSKLPAIFKEEGVITAKTASGFSDGAASVVIAEEEAVKKEGLTPLARLVGWSAVGVEPTLMGIGPVAAIESLLKANNLTLNDIDLVEINEAFSVQALACVKALNLDLAKVNVSGGAIAIGHPFAASGARITGHLIYELKRRGLKRGIGSACIGGGQGIAVLIEAV